MMVSVILVTKETSIKHSSVLTGFVGLTIIPLAIAACVPTDIHPTNKVEVMPPANAP